MNIQFLRVWLIVLGPWTMGQLNAQRINFGTYASDGITITQVSAHGLDFNLKTPLIVAGSNENIQIQIHDEEVVVFEIQGLAHLDVTVEINRPLFLQKDASNMIPVDIRWAYSNLASNDILSAQLSAIELQSAFQTFNFPMVRRSSGAPGPPPTPEYEGYVAPMATAYLFIYGSLGPVGNIAAGLYDGQVNITVSYTEI